MSSLFLLLFAVCLRALFLLGYYVEVAVFIFLDTVLPQHGLFLFQQGLISFRQYFVVFLHVSRCQIAYQQDHCSLDARHGSQTRISPNCTLYFIQFIFTLLWVRYIV